MHKTAMERPYKALFIDIDNTLLTFRPSAEIAFRKTFEAMGITYEPSYYEVYYWIGDVLWTQQQRQQITVQEIHDTIFHRLLAALAIDADADAFGKFFHQQLHEEAILEPEAAEALSYLSERYKLYVASNGMLDMQRSRLQVAGILHYFSDLFVSDDIGAEKPSEAFFEEAMRRSGVAPNESLFIGDSLQADMTGALRSGIDRCWYNSHAAPVPESLPLNYVIQHLSEVKTFL